MNIEELSGYGISKEIAKIIEEGFSYDEETGEVFFTTDDLEALQMALDDKLAQLDGVYLCHLAKIEAMKNRKKEVEKSIKQLENKAENLKKYIDFLMKTNGKTSFEKDDKKISYRKSVSSNIYDEKALREYIKSKDEYEEKYFKISDPEINKKALSDDVKATKQEDGSYALNIPGFELVTNENIQIK